MGQKIDKDNLGDKGDIADYRGGASSEESSQVASGKEAPIKGAKDQGKGLPTHSNQRCHSTIEKSLAEAIVLTLAAGLPVLQPPPKQHVRGSHQAASFAVGGVTQAGDVAIPIQGYTQNPFYNNPPSSEVSDAIDSTYDWDYITTYARSLLALTTSGAEETTLNDHAQSEQLKLMLLAMALGMLYFSAYGGVTEEEFASLFSKEAGLPEPIAPLMNQFIASIEERLPKDLAARKVALKKLTKLFNGHHSLTSILQATRYVSQVLVRASGSEVAKNGQGIDLFLGHLMSVEDKKNTLIHAISNNYTKKLVEFSKRMNGEDILSWLEGFKTTMPKSSSEYYAYILASASIQKSGKENGLLDQFTQAFNQWVLDPNKESALAKMTKPASEIYPSSSFIAGCMVCSVDIVTEATKGSPGVVNQIIADNPITDVFFAVAPQAALLPDYQAAAALIAALLNNGAVYKATEDALKEGENKGAPPKDLDFAISYAKNIIAIVTHRRSSLSIKNKEIQERDRIIRLMLSVMALNMLYRSFYGGMTGEEFGTILKGETVDIHDRIRNLIETLAGLVQDNLPKNQQAAVKVIEALMDYIDSKDSINSMLKSTRVLAKLLSTQDLDQKRFEAESG